MEENTFFAQRASLFLCHTPLKRKGAAPRYLGEMSKPAGAVASTLFQADILGFSKL
jgi:hypothetical protein